MKNKVQPANKVVTDDECFVSGALAIVLRVSRYLGTASLRFSRKDDGWIVGLSPQISMLSGFIITFTGLLNHITNFSDKFYAIKEQRTEWNATQRVMRFTESFLMATMAMWMVYSAPTHMKDLIRCLNQVHKIHLELKIKHWPKQQKKYIALVILWITLCVIINFSDYLAVSLFINRSPLWIKVCEVLYYIHYIVIQSCVLQFALTVTHVKSSLTAINEHLKSLLKDVKNKKQVCVLGSNGFCNTNADHVTRFNNYIDSYRDRETIVPDSKMKAGYSTTLHTLSCAYGATCCAMRAVDRAHGTMLMLMLAFLFQHLMSAPYFLITNIVYGEYTLDDRLYIFHGSMLFAETFLHLFNLLLIIEPCHLTHLEMQTSHDLLSHLMHCTDSAHHPLVVELEQFYRNITVNKLCYKPLNVITICRGLVIDIVGSVTTYLVILIKLK